LEAQPERRCVGAGPTAKSIPVFHISLPVDVPPAEITRPPRGGSMSALGQKQTLRKVRVMSALPPKADIGWAGRDVRFVPEAEVTHALACSRPP